MDLRRESSIISYSIFDFSRYYNAFINMQVKSFFLGGGNTFLEEMDVYHWIVVGRSYRNLRCVPVSFREEIETILI